MYVNLNITMEVIMSQIIAGFNKGRAGIAFQRSQLFLINANVRKFFYK